MLLTPQQLKAILPLNRTIPELTDALNSILPKYDINTTERLAMFIGQCSHESRQFTVNVENLNYSESGLLKTFPKYFNKLSAKKYARNPEMIANRVYANRMGNGDEKSGDGWRYRGQGCIQLTGKSNFEAFARFMGISLDNALVYIRSLEGSIEAACFFWASRNLNSESDRLDIRGATKKINGGYNGLDDRIENVNLALQVLRAEPETTTILRNLKQGDQGPDVFQLQQILTKNGFRVKVDGNFGIGTHNALMQFQTANGLKADGVAGPKTREFLK